VAARGTVSSAPMRCRATLVLAVAALGAWAGTAFAQPSAQFLTGHAESNVVTLWWSVTGPVDLVRAWRQDAGDAEAPWILIADTLALSGSTAYVEDRDVTEGARNDYRLGLVLAGVETFSPTVRMFLPGIPAEAAFQLLRLVPDGLELVWATARLPQAFVERRDIPAVTWQRLGTAIPYGDGHARWIDFEPEPGDSVEYQLVAGGSAYGRHRFQVPEPRLANLLVRADSRSVRLVFQALGKCMDAVLQRREAGSREWTSVGYRVLDSQRQCEFLDGPVFVGRTYHYRAGVDGTTQRQWSPEITVTIQPPPAFSARAAWNPATAQLALDVDMPLNATAGFVVFDAFGRRRWSHALRLVEGEHALRFALPGLPPGVYYLQARVHDLTVSSRFALYR
jgi:hypothetical protein